MISSSAKINSPHRLMRLGAIFCGITTICFAVLLVTRPAGSQTGEVRAVTAGKTVPVAGNLLKPEKPSEAKTGETPEAKSARETKATTDTTAEPKTPKTDTAQDKAETETKKSAKKTNKDFEKFLDRLMLAESGGRDNAKNPRSTALGPFQFIESTFLHVARSYLAEDIKGLTRSQILAKRTDRTFARNAAAAYSHENAAHLAANGIPATYPNLRLAFLLGPQGALNVIKADKETPLFTLLSPAAMRANPFMAAMSAGELRDRAAREISLDPGHRLASDPRYKGRKIKSGPRIAIKCNLQRPSCRRWLALKRNSLKLKDRQKTAGASR